MTNLIADPIVVVGFAVRLPGADGGVESFEKMLFEGGSAVAPLTASRFDHDLYFDEKRGAVGKTYTTLGSCVRSDAFGKLKSDIASLGEFDLAHKHFAEVASNCWEMSGASQNTELAKRCGIFVGHSGGTELGGSLALATLAETVADQLRSIDAFAQLPPLKQQSVVNSLTESIRSGRPHRERDTIHFNAYSVASLAARMLGLGGPREVIDAACASSLLALQHAVLTIEHGRIDTAIVGGATFNNVDNLILFSQSQACSEKGSCPFDDTASGLVSSEGYVAIAIMRESLALEHNFKIHGIIRGVGVASDGRGKSLWAPRTEGQQLALRRAYPNANPLSIDYQEAHATSTQVGDATELTSLSALLAESSRVNPLLVGSVKSNFGHTLEAAGLVGLVKVLLAMHRETIPPSINLTQPTKLFDWSAKSLAVVDRPTPWPKSTGSRRAAVNAFGIGGLNAHAVVEQAQRESTLHRPQSRMDSPPATREPIAIVGRGLVLAGAGNVNEFLALLQSNHSSIAAPPQDRWRASVGVRTHSSPTTFNAPTNVGGYIRDYHFDGQKYRIPPKQVRLANPAQMMLIDAVAQACHEFDGGTWSLNRERTGIVVGTIFGGEFSNQLQIGLRLPEIAKRLQFALQQSAINPLSINEILVDFQKRLLDEYSAILDETGSFTASTLASRIAKTFDLMGGACAVDADDASSGLALMLAADQLQSGTLDTVICGVAQRSLDLVAFEQLDLKEQLVRSGLVRDIPADCSRILPGEGVAAVMLMRLADAKREQRPIFGVIDEINCGVTSNGPRLRSESLAESSLNHQIASRVGYLAGAHSVVRLITESFDSSKEKAPTTITCVAEDGFFTSVSVKSPNAPSKPAIDQPAKMAPVPCPAGPKTAVFSTSTDARSLKFDSMLTLRLEADTEHEFDSVLQSACRSVSEHAVRLHFRADSIYRAVAIGKSESELSASVAAIRKSWDEGARVQSLPRHLALLWNTRQGRDRIGWVFPGQGSQYSAVPQIITQDAGASEFLKQFDATLIRMGHSAVTENLADPQKRLGRDVWWTQQWVLAVSSTLADSLSRHGHSPDVTLGHSFGECGAALHCGVMTIPQAIRFAKLRSDAVVMTARQTGQLLSIRSEPSQVRGVLTKHRLDCYITHQNAPNQTVIAGDVAQIESAKNALSEEGYASVVIPVPAAFHTPWMADAQRVLASGFGHETLRPPKHAFLSATSTSYLAEPNEIRAALIEQLTHPVLYATTVQRMVNDGCGLLIEVGPSDVLTRLNLATVGTDAICLSLDSNVGTHAERLRLIDLAVECVKGTRSESQATPTIRSIANYQTPESKSPVTKAPSNVEIIDVTSRARRVANADGPATASPAAASPATASKPASRPEPTRQPDPLPTAAIRQAQSTPTTSIDAAKQFLVDIVVELTGYEPEVIDFEADLEAELGVDSIKKAQVIGELAEWASLELNLREMKLADFNSLGDILSLVADIELPATNESTNVVVAQAKETDSTSAAIVMSTPFVQTSPVPAALPTNLAASIESLMVDFVVDQTGYDPEVIDLDADLESELGIDSIKKAQLLGELAEQYDLRDVELGRLSLADFLNLRSILEFVLENCDDASRLETQSIGPISTVSEEASFEAGHSSAIDSQQDEDFAEGQLIGSLKKNEIRNRLREQLDQATKVEPDWLANLVAHSTPNGSNGHTTSNTKPSPRLIDGIAHGAGVHPASLHNGNGSSNGNGASKHATESPVRQVAFPDVEVPSHGTCRFLLDVVRRDRRAGTPIVPTFHGDALIIGDNPISSALVRRLKQLGVTTHQLKDVGGDFDVDKTLENIWSLAETPHLFLTTPHDESSLRSLDASAWETRRSSAIFGVFRVCQLWMQRMIDLDRMGHASLVTTTNGGGAMGLAGSQLESPESGGLAGLTKAMLIESWMRGFRDTPMKVIEFAENSTPDRFIDGVMRELAVPSYDEETIVDADRRWTVRARYAPVNKNTDIATRITRGGTWIVTGGGRGITAMTAMELAQRHGLKLALLGTAPAPSLQPGIRERGCENRSQLRRDVMLSAQQAGLNPIETWRDTEKSLEIDITLAECERRGIEATYYSVDVSDAVAVSEIISHVRNNQGPIRGVIHGAGAGQDSRFDRKRPDKVEKCIRAKVDGCMALAAATATDSLEWFVGFGSISGRFGANGHTDYSLANDMLAKCINRLSSDRPSVRCVTFHWHAWGDIGMAAKPEAKLALEMIGMQFMPAEEGLEHFLNELEFGGDSPEVLITDRNYVRKFFPDVERSDATSLASPILDPTGKSATRDIVNHVVTLDPVTDRFLKEHRINDRPTLPFVVALEMMAEAALLASGDRHVTKCTSAQAFQAIKFVTDDAMAVEVNATDPKGQLNHWTIQADLRRKDGRLVEEGRKHFEAAFVTAPTTVMSKLNLPVDQDWTFTAIDYLPPGAVVFHGEPLQALREIAIAPGEALGRIAAPSPAHLGGENRPLSGWILPCAAMDAVLYAAATLAYYESGRPSLPVSFDEIRIGRQPDPGEPLLTHIRAIQSDERGMILAADLAGQNGDLILSLHGYRISWIR